MKTIGLIGGMSWESSQLYYKLINEKVKEKLGGFHSAKSVMISVDFDEVAKLQADDDWDSLDTMMVAAAIQIENAGADMILVCANTMHLCSEKIIKNTCTMPIYLQIIRSLLLVHLLHLLPALRRSRPTFLPFLCRFVP